MTRDELIAAIKRDPDLVDRGYDFAELDRQGYCLWAIDCAEHLLPLAKRSLASMQHEQLLEAISATRAFVEHGGDTQEIEALAKHPRQIANEYCDSKGEIPYFLSETLDAISNSIELAIPNTKVYHEDVIYAASRAALDGELHLTDQIESFGSVHTTGLEALAGVEESEAETRWQLNALIARVTQQSK